MDIQDNKKAPLGGAQDDKGKGRNNIPTPTKKTPKIKKKPISALTKIPPKPNNDETFQVYNLLRMGYNESEIRSMHNDWEDKKFSTIMKQARAIQQKAVLDYDAAKADVLDKLWHNYQLAQEIGDIKDSTVILQAISKILGLTRDVNFEGSQFVTVWAK